MTRFWKHKKFGGASYWADHYCPYNPSPLQILWSLFVSRLHCKFSKVSMFEYNFNFVKTFLIWCFQDFTKSKFILMNFIYLKHEFFNILRCLNQNLFYSKIFLALKNTLSLFRYIFRKLQKFSSIQRYPKLFLRVSNELLHFIFSENIKYNILRKYIFRREIKKTTVFHFLQNAMNITLPWGPAYFSLC